MSSICRYIVTLIHFHRECDKWLDEMRPNFVTRNFDSTDDGKLILKRPLSTLLTGTELILCTTACMQRLY